MKRYYWLSLLAVILLTSSCSYRWRTVSVDEAIEAEKRVLIKTDYGDYLKYRKLMRVDSSYFAEVRIKGEEYNVAVDVKRFEEVKMKGWRPWKLHEAILFALMTVFWIFVLFGPSS